MKKVQSFQVGSFSVGSDALTIIAGPCMAESKDLCDEVCTQMKSYCESIGAQFIFKASFDKANRTSVNSERGPGLEGGLEILQEIKNKHGVPVTTDVHLPEQANPVAGVVDILQVPAFLCRQSDLLEACANSGKPVNVKKGQFLAPWDAENITRKLEQFNAKGIMLTERGTTFGYNTLIVDMPGLEIMRGFGHPVCFDATHSAQRPGGAGTSTGGVRESIPAMTRAALAVGVDALFLEVHPDPEKAMSDAATQWPLNRASELFDQIAEFNAARKRVQD